MEKKPTSLGDALYTVDLQREQIKSLQQIINELSTSEDTLKKERDTLRKDLAQKTQENDDWKRKAFLRLTEESKSLAHTKMSSNTSSSAIDDDVQPVETVIKKKKPKPKEPVIVSTSHTIATGSTSSSDSGDSKQKEIEHLKALNEELNKRNEFLTKEKDELDEKVKQLGSQLEQTKKELEEERKEKVILLEEKFKLYEERESLLDGLTKYSSQVTDLTEDLKQRTIPVPPEFKLPETEYTIAYFSCKYNVPGYLYIFPHYVGFISSITGWAINFLNTATLVIPITDIVGLNKISAGFIRKHTVKSFYMDIYLKDKSIIQLSSLFKRKEIVKMIIHQAKEVNHKIKVLRDGTEDTNSGLD
eukprot:TRINITY_DN242_c0_g3_i1.p1 TRINITY_DN242_c0_g3~~TRINITY_DN242_c0_g3_i1.p1  ORF type:complete len:360 (-),score=78.93 TRINITY_DN242_c0_g3_i1:94-1173(-)